MDRKYCSVLLVIFFFIFVVYQAMCSVHGSVCHDGQVLPKDPGAGACKPPYVFLIWCYVIVLGFLFTDLEEHTGLYLGVIVLPGKASWHWLLKVTFFFILA